MRVLIKDLVSNGYADGNGSWVSVPEGAFDFGSPDCAIEFVLNSKFVGTKMALQFVAPERMRIYRLPKDPLVLRGLMRRARSGRPSILCP